MGSAGLTEMGRRMSFEVGRRISSGRPMELYTSFVPRAYETAECIGEGYSEIGGEAAEVELLPTLVSPHILNPEVWLHLHPDGQNITDYVNSWVKGEFEGYIEPYEDYRTKFMNDTVGRLVASEGNVIYIYTTHDFTLMSAKRMFLDRNLDYDDREPFLGGLGLTLSDSGVEVFIGSANRAISICR
jgi:broad specificity phosphatase PhoE